MNDPLYNHVVFGPTKGKGGQIGKSDDQLIQDLIAIHNAENWLGMDGDSDLSMFNGKEGGGRGKEDRNGSKDKSRNDIDDIRVETKSKHTIFYCLRRIFR